MARDGRCPDTPFWVEPGGVRAERLFLTAEESHHLLNVHRAGRGTAFEAVDGEGTLYHCTIEAVERHAVIGRIVGRDHESGELTGSIHLLLGTPDFPAAEAVISRAVPLGVTSIQFLHTERSEPWRVTDVRSARLSRLARAALKQCRRTRLPTITFAPSLSGATVDLPVGPRFLADPAGAPWSESTRSGVFAEVALAIGPPGGFVPEEVDLLRGERFVCISLGPNRLTTEDSAGALLALARQIFIAETRPRH